MSAFKMSEEEKATIRKQHEDATKKFYERKTAEKSGLKLPEKPKEEKKK